MGLVVVVPNIPLPVNVSPPSGSCFASFVPVALALGSVREGDRSARPDFGRSPESFSLGGFVVLSLAIVGLFGCMYFGQE